MSYAADPRVDAYIDALPDWQQAICRRSATWSTPPTPRSSRRSSAPVQPYFVLDGNICALLAAKDHVNVFLYDGAIVPDPEGIITAGHDNKTARTVAFRQGEPINAPALTAMFRQIIANNRAGGWRKLKRERGGVLDRLGRARDHAARASGEQADVHYATNPPGSASRAPLRTVFVQHTASLSRHVGSVVLCT